MTLALFDLDDTLIQGNCETAWFEHLAKHGHIDAKQCHSKLDYYERQYANGVSDINDYMLFVLSTLTNKTMPELLSLRNQWLRHSIEPIVAQGTASLLQQHRDVGDTLVIITASNSFCAEPIAQLLKVEHYICTQAILENDQYTGQFKHPACFAAGKLTLLFQWLEQNGHTLRHSTFYSDSHNDLPLLERVENPIAVDANPQLKLIAEQRGWQSISLRKP